MCFLDWNIWCSNEWHNSILLSIRLKLNNTYLTVKHLTFLSPFLPFLFLPSLSLILFCFSFFLCADSMCHKNNSIMEKEFFLIWKNSCQIDVPLSNYYHTREGSRYISKTMGNGWNKVRVFPVCVSNKKYLKFILLQFILQYFVHITFFFISERGKKIRCCYSRFDKL